MASSFEPWKDINEVTDDVLQGILKYGDIEEIVSKDRICERFRFINDSILKEKKKLTTIRGRNSGQFKKCPYSNDYFLEHVMEVFERMPKLTDGGELGFEKWTLRQIQKLACINPNLTKFKDQGHQFYDRWRLTINVVRYISAVKQNTSSYNGIDVKHVLNREELDYGLGDLDPDWDLKMKVYLSTDDGLGHQLGTKVLYRLALRAGHRLETLCPSVKELEISSRYEHIDDILKVPNTEAVTIYGDTNMYRQLSTIFTHLGTNLKKLVIENIPFYHETNWTEIDTSCLRRIVDNSPLEVLHVSKTGAEGINIIQAILNSPQRSLKSVCLDTDGYLVSEIDIKGDTIMIRSFKYWEQIKDIYIRFNHVKKIFFNFHAVTLTPQDIYGLKELRDSNRKRSLALESKSMVHFPLF